jgi:hypothetical protein
MTELSEYVLPHFPAGNLAHQALPALTGATNHDAR